MKNENKTISIIIPVYNAEKYIVNTIETAETQEKYVDYEIVIVNDGSTDSSKKQVEDLIKAKNYKNIRLINTKNNGVSIARNIGIQESKGDYIIFLDADDELKSNALKELSKIIKYNHDIIVFNYEYKELNNNIKQRIIYDEESKKIDNEKLKMSAISSSKLNNVWQFCISREYLIANNIKFKKDIKIAEDLFFNLEMISYNPSIYYLNEILYRYNFNPGSAMQNLDLKKIEQRLQDTTNLYIKFYDYLKRWNINTEENRSKVALKYYRLLYHEFNQIIKSRSKFKDKIFVMKKYIKVKETKINKRNIKIRDYITNDLFFLYIENIYLYYASRIIKNKIKKFVEGK